MTGGMPFGLLGVSAMPTLAPADVDPSQMQLDDEQQRALLARLVGRQVFHPGSMGAPVDQDQDQGQGGPMQSPSGPSFDAQSARAMPIPNASPNDATAFLRQAPYDPSNAPPLLRTGSSMSPTGAPPSASPAGYGASAQDGPQPSPEPALASVLRGMPSMAAGQMAPPQMPAPPQGGPPPGGPQQDAQPQPPQGLLSGIPSMIGAAFPQMPQPGGPQATGAIPQQAQPAQASAPGDDDEEAGPAPAATAPSPAARAVPLPPQRPSDGSILGNAGITPVNSFDPLTGQPVSGSPQPVRGDFDPLTGQPVSGTPRPLGALSPAAPQAGPQGGPAPAQAPASQDDHSFLKTWQRIADSGIGDQLLAMSAGAFQGKTLGESLGRGIQNMLAVKQAAGTGDMQRLEYALKLQEAQQKQTTLTGNANYVKAIFAKNGQQISDQQALTLGGNPTIMNDLLKGIMPPTEAYTQETDKNGDTWQTNTRTGQRSLLKAADKDDVQLITDPVTGTVRAVRKSEVFDDKGSGGGQAGGGNGGDGTAGNVRTVFEGNKGLTPLTDPTARLKAGIRQNDDRAAWIGPDGKVTFEPTAPSTTINMPPAEKAEQSAIGTARAGVIKEHIEAGRAARDKIQILDQMRGALDAAGPNMMTGPLGEPVLRAKQALGGMLGTQLPGTSATEMFANSGPVLAGAAARAITSRPAQIEFTTMLNAKPGLMNSPEGNRASMDVMRQSAVRDADLSDIAARSSSVDEFIRKRDEYEHAHPMINPFTGRPFGSATPAAPGPLNTQGATAPSLTDLQAEARRRGLIR